MAINNSGKGKLDLFRQRVRRTNGLTIFWIDEETVQVSTRDGATVVFNRWFLPRSHYKLWKKFSDAIRRNNSLTEIWDVMDIARRYDIEMCSPIGRARKVPDDIEEVPSIWGRDKKDERNQTTYDL